MKKILDALQLHADNAGACFGASGWLNNSAGKKIISTNPANEEILATVYAATEQDYEKIMQTATEAFIEWRMRPAPARGEIVRQIGEALRQNKQTLGQLVTLEIGKSLQEGLGEVQEMIDMADFAVGQARMLYGCSMHSERPRHRMYEQWQPLGVVGVISAFNFPVAVWAWNAFIAAICGNTVVWKPSHKTPLTALAVQHICNRVMADNNLKGIFSLFITDETALAEKFVEDTRVALLSFTGSTTIGRRINEKVARRMGKILLELGGNNAIIVDDTADLNLAVPAIVFGATGTAGQRCTTTRRLFVQDTIYAKMIATLTHAYHQITLGDPLDEKNLMGPLIDADAVKQYEKAIAAIRAAGGNILAGGKAVQRPGHFVEPTLVEAENHFAIVQQETFAPILYVIKFKKIEEAIQLQNASLHGLSSALFSNHIRHSELFLSAIGSDCGIANINIGTSGAEIGGAFGGEKQTGGGREAGSDAWKTYMRRQTVTVNWDSQIALAQGIQFSLAHHEP